MDKPEIDTDRIDDAVLALMYLTLHEEDRLTGTARSWKGFDWNALSRLHTKDLILNPVGNAKSVVLTEEGRKQCEELFYSLFAK